VIHFVFSAAKSDGTNARSLALWLLLGIWSGGKPVDPRLRLLEDVEQARVYVVECHRFGVCESRVDVQSFLSFGYTIRERTVLYQKQPMRKAVATTSTV
jgi:hypothetical protein